MATTDTERPKSILVILRRVYLDIVEGNHCAAKLIEYFKHWRNWKLKVHRTEWVYMPLKRIHEDLMGEHSLHVIRNAIAKLIDLGILKRRNNPGNGQDKTYQYQLQMDVLQQKLSELPFLKEESPKCKNESSKFNAEQHTQNLSTNIKSTEQTESGSLGSPRHDCQFSKTGDVEKSFPQAEKILRQYEEKLKLYGIYRLSWSGESLIPNPRMQPVFQALAKIPLPSAERAIQAFLRWIREARNVQDKYKALKTALAQRWD